MSVHIPGAGDGLSVGVQLPLPSQVTSWPLVDSDSDEQPGARVNGTSAINAITSERIMNFLPCPRLVHIPFRA
jgi:hypothetical protein